ncbi:ALF repeat-containing protein, partial [Streptomyces sp. NPDC056296]|uniref:ALF repeat-containing protein n=1 Tax=Streptomyces sp. NPDC056296 TaxID=3345775 RepID=UPI0035D5E3B3
AGIAQTLAGRAAPAARVARDAANSAAEHALKAAAAAEEAADNAGKAIEYAKRSTEYANAAVTAANTAADAVKEAQEVEQAAREAETARIAEDTELGVAEARLRAQAEIEDTKRADQQRTRADATATEIKDLVAAAEAALGSGDTATAVTNGRKAAVELLDSTGSWTREAAEYALSGSDDDILNWLGADRLLAQGQDDRENVLTVAELATPAVAEAAALALASTAPNAIPDFLHSGAIEAAAEDNRVAVFALLNNDPGAAVKAGAEAALNDGSARALHRFLTVELADATKEDDNVEIFRLLNSGGPYMKQAAQIVLEGSARMRRAFVVHDKFKVARLDEDHATHVAAIRAAIAHAAKVAAKALENAALASKAAAEAREAASEASEWAAKAQGYAKDAANSAKEAKDNADAADRSAAAAAQSAKSATSAAATARGAARSANYSMRQAAASAKQAVASAASAQSSASAARASAIQAGKDAQAAAAAASEARAIVVEKRRAEAAAAARKVAEAAKKAEAEGTNPSDKPEHDNTGDTDYLGLWPEDASDVRDWAAATGHWSTVLGGISLGLSLVAPFTGPFAPIVGGVAVGVGLVSWGIQGVSALLSLGYDGGWRSPEFHTALGVFVIGGIFQGKSAIFRNFKIGGKSIAEEVGSRISSAVGDTATTVIGLLTW